LPAFLVDHGLKNGYGPYWIAPVTTASTDGRASIHAVITDFAGLIGPFRWFSEESEYTHFANFVVIDLDPDEYKFFAVTTKRVIQTFGAPASIYPVGTRFIVLVWDHNITPALSTGRSFTLSYWGHP